MRVASLVTRGVYHDSVVLLALARELRAAAGVSEAAALMGTPANRDLLRQSGLATEESDGAGPNDLVIAVRAETADAARQALARAHALLTARRATASARISPRTIDGARRHVPEANLALISVPGPFAAAEAGKALSLGLHVMLFSDNVPIEDEIRLKQRGLARGLLVMGPDCGTAHVNGIPLGFANVVPRGRVGLVAASGTGLQQVAVLLAARGEGISQAVGVGGRDMSEAVGGLMTLAAIEALGADARTELIVVIGKPPARRVRERVEGMLADIGKPAVVALLGPGVETRETGRIRIVGDLEAAAEASLAALAGGPWQRRAFSAQAETVAAVEYQRRALAPGQRAVRGLYTGGTLAHEAALILASLLGPVTGNLGGARKGGGAGSPHLVIDLGADEYTVGRAHPMIDATARVAHVLEAGRDPEVAVLLVDLVLGHGAATDPAGDLAPAIEAARAHAISQGRGLAVVASVVGTAGDPQGLAGQVARLETAGTWVLPSNAQAARAAACIAGGPAVLAACLGSGQR
jgi:succinyl-CoA synthetase alpha subunit